MMQSLDQVRSEFPELRQLTDQELSTLLELAQRHVAPERGDLRGAIAMMALFFAGCALYATAYFWAWILLLVHEKAGAPAVIAIIAAAVAGPAYTWKFLSLKDRIRVRRQAFEWLLGNSRRCLECDYDLSGLAHEDARPGVVRCPECGLVNPAPITHQSS